MKLPTNVESKFTPEPNTGCWLWHAARNRRGYGVVRYNGKARLAHRVMLELIGKYIPDGMDPDHLCRTPECVNPDHLEIVSHRENCRRGMTGKHNSNKTHCNSGHLFDASNTARSDYKGWNSRRCRKCHNTLTLRRYHEKKGRC